MTLGELQRIIHDTYDAKDRRRGVEGTFMWFMEEVGELSAALRSGTPEERAAEFADVLLEAMGELGTSHSYVTPSGVFGAQSRVSGQPASVRRFSASPSAARVG